MRAGKIVVVFPGKVVDVYHLHPDSTRAELGFFLGTLAKLPGGAAKLGVFLLTELMEHNKVRWSVTELAETLGQSCNTIAAARENLVEAGLLRLESRKRWVLVARGKALAGAVHAA